MQVGDLVRVKDSVGYNAYMQNLVGHIGVICEEAVNENYLWVVVHILGRNRSIEIRDLEVISEGR
jgi:hypothetical protein